MRVILISIPIVLDMHFFGIDLVMGNKGFQRLLQDKGSCNKHEDGNYTLIEKNNTLIEKNNENNYILSRDYHGYYPIFYYSSGNYWCNSNSIIYMVERLKEQGRSISFNTPNVELWKSHLAFVLQLTSHHTFVNKIKVLPVNRNIVITKDHTNSDIVLVKIEQDSKSNQSYREALIDCLEVWRGRYLTILGNHQMGLWYDLTEGLDSRFLFSFMVNHLAMAKDTNHDGILRVNSYPKHTEDFKIANRLVLLFDLSVNAKINDYYKSAKVPATENYAVWKYFNISRYAPIVFPQTDFSSHYIEMGGEGGGDNRNFYSGTANGKYDTLPKFVEKRYKGFLSTEEWYADWMN